MASDDEGLAKQTGPTLAYCSWCRKPAEEVGPLVEGPGTGAGSVYICEDCARLCLSMIDIERRRREEQFPYDRKEPRNVFGVEQAPSSEA